MPNTVQYIMKNEMLEGDSMNVSLLAASITEFPKRRLVAIQASMGLAHKYILSTILQKKCFNKKHFQY